MHVQALNARTINAPANTLPGREDAALGVTQDNDDVVTRDNVVTAWRRWPPAAACAALSVNPASGTG